MMDRKSLGSRIIFRVGVPWFASLVVANVSPLVPPQIGAVMPYVAHLLEIGWIAGIASIFAEEILEVSFLPAMIEAFKLHFLPAFQAQMQGIQEILGKSIGDTGVLLLQELQREVPPPATAAELMGEDPAVAKIKTALLEGRFLDARKGAEQLAEKDPGQAKHLLTILMVSPGRAEWEEAIQLLPQFGESRHYLMLAYRYWQEGEHAKAVDLAEKGLAMAIQSNKGPAIAAFKNSVAYYYADMNLQEKAELARQYAEEALSYRQENREPTDKIAKTRATVGYVKITFGRTRQEVVDGMNDSEEARRGGAREDLYFKHLARAQQRLASL